MRVAALTLAVTLTASAVSAQSNDKRPMTFLDMRLMKDAGSPAPSPDRRWMLYTVSTPDWTEAKSQQDVYLVSLQQGLPSTRQMTFTKDKNETSPQWAKDSRFFAFLSNRDAPENAAADHLKALARISRLLQDEAFRRRLMAGRSAEELFTIIAEEDEKF